MYLCILSKILPVVVVELVHKVDTELSQHRQLLHCQGNTVIHHCIYVYREKYDY